MTDTQTKTTPRRQEILCLIGYRGTGKTSVAGQLAEQLGWPCSDSDHVVETEARRTIAEIFTSDGEGAFRDLECAAVASLLGEGPHIVSLGGGAILRPENRRLLADKATTVWLRATPETLHARLTADPNSAAGRPNLTTDGGLLEIQRVLEQRAPLYRECADLVVDTEDKDVAAVAAEILQRLP